MRGRLADAFGRPMNLIDHREEVEIAARADATFLKTRSMAKSVELGMTMSGAWRVR